MNDARRLVDEQAEDEGLWFVATTAAEAYLQQELRRLHAAVEASPLYVPVEVGVDIDGSWYAEFPDGTTWDDTLYAALEAEA